MEPFGWPRGTVRGAIVLILAAGLVPVGIWGTGDALAGYTGIAGFVLRDYFAHRQEENDKAGPVLPPPVANDDVR